MSGHGILPKMGTFVQIPFYTLKHPKIQKKNLFSESTCSQLQKTYTPFFHISYSSGDICERRKFEGVLLTFVRRFHIINLIIINLPPIFRSRFEKKKSKIDFASKSHFLCKCCFCCLCCFFLLLKCCLSKSPYSDLHFEYPSFSHISYSLRVILD